MNGSVHNESRSRILEGAKLVKEKLGFDDYFRYYIDAAVE